MSNKFEDNDKKKVMYDCKVLRDMNSSGEKCDETNENKKKKNYVIFYLSLSAILITVLMFPYLKKLSGVFNKVGDKLCFNSDNSLTSKESSGSGIVVNSESTGTVMSAAQIYEKNVKSVVGILVSPETDDSYGFGGFDDFSEFFGGGKKGPSLGSGMVISSDGYILTNAHVVNAGGNKVKIRVAFKEIEQQEDDDDFSDTEEAELIGMDKTIDLAIIKIKRNDLIPVTFGNSDNIAIGSDVCTMGYPLGLDKSITRGIVSGLNRKISQDIWSTTYIQTDAAINPGNSGGPLFNDKGEVVGVNTIKIAESSADNLGFAIPSNEAVNVAGALIEHGYFPRPMLGITIVDKKGSVKIKDVDKRSGLSNFVERGDEILAINGKNVTSSRDLVSEIKKFKIGDRVNIRIEKRATGEKRDVPVTLFDANKK